MTNKDKSAVLAKAGPNKPGATEEAAESRGLLSWMVGWLVLPAVVVALIFGGGVAVGVHMHESWFTRLVLWVVGLFS